MKIPIVLSALLVCAVAGQTNPPAKRLQHVSDDEFREVRRLAWKAFSEIRWGSDGLPSADQWINRKEVNGDKHQFHPPVELLQQRALYAALIGEPAASGPPTHAKPLIFPKDQSAVNIWESTFYDGSLAEEIRALPKGGASRLVDVEKRNTLQFKPGSRALKTFWYIVPKAGADVAKWNWLKLPDNLENVCISATQAPGCQLAKSQFQTTVVADPEQFDCATSQDCQPKPQKGDTMILVALHIAEKSKADWLWATFWWRGDEDPDPRGDLAPWTCGNAQRGNAGNVVPWSYYSMDAISSFLAKPPIDAMDACGAPKPLPRSVERYSAYNPFIEAQEKNGLESSCIRCHARASTSNTRPTGVPDALNGGLSLELFEGQVRTDYLWTVTSRIGMTGPVDFTLDPK